MLHVPIQDNLGRVASLGGRADTHQKDTKPERYETSFSGSNVDHTWSHERSSVLKLFLQSSISALKS